jgi:hypothetical protein
MRSFTSAPTQIRRFGHAFWLVAAITACGALNVAASEQSEAGSLDGRAVSDSAEIGDPNETLVENGWDFEKPDTIPGFGSMVTPFDMSND